MQKNEGWQKEIPVDNGPVITTEAFTRADGTCTTACAQIMQRQGSVHVDQNQQSQLQHNRAGGSRTDHMSPQQQRWSRQRGTHLEYLTDI